MKIKKIVLTRPKLVLDTRCPKCHTLDIAALTNIKITCKNCNAEFTENLGINIYYSIAKKLLQTISHCKGRDDEVHIQAERDDSDVFNADDLLKPRSMHEDERYNTLLAIKHNFEDQKCYEVSEITNEMDVQNKVYCNDCGICKNCVTCTKCSKSYVPNIVQTKTGEQKRYKCPDCGNRKYTQTFIEKLIDKCPNCKSRNTRRTSFNPDKKQCPRCKTKKIPKSRLVPIYKLVIKRQKRFTDPEK